MGTYIKSGSIGINITHSQDTAWPKSLPQINCRETALPCPLDRSGVTGIDIRRFHADFMQVCELIS
jgi:hypothetical protein